jgi:hypothetical protein
MVFIYFLLTGLVVSIINLQVGTRLTSASMVALAIWLLRYDIARKTIKKPGLPRFAAICLLLSYGWLVVAGILGLIYGALPAGLRYDAYLHAIFLGFVFSMIFGHAPIIFPAILGLPIQYTPTFYTHVVLLHLSLVMRITGDLLSNWTLRLWGGLLNGVAILLFLGLTAWSIRKASNIKPFSGLPK